MVNKSMGLKVLILPLSLAVVVLVAVIYIQPAFSDLMNAKNSVAEDQTQLANLQTQSQKLASLKQSWQSMSEKSLVETALPSDKSIEEYLSEVYQIAARSGVIISNASEGNKSGATGASQPFICPDSSALAQGADSSLTSQASGGSSADSTTAAVAKPALNSCVNAVSLGFTIKGNWDQLLAFFKSISATNRYADLQSVSLSSQSATDAQANSDVLTSEISVGVYYKQRSSSSAAASLAVLSSGGFDKNILSEIRNYSSAPLTLPSVSAGGERNIFK